MSLLLCRFLRIDRGIIAAIMIMASLLPFAVNAGEVSGMDREETVISADSVTITILFDNIPYDDGCATSGGYSCLVEVPGTVILFDTGGNGPVLLENMEHLGIDPGAVDIVLLSHEHWDHTGGLDGFLDSNPEVYVYIPGTFGGEIRDVLSKHGIESVDVDRPVEIAPGVRSCGVMGDAIYEQAISIATDRGPIVITGCAHPGIADITVKAKELAGRAPLLVMGGWHLGGSSKARIDAIIETFDEMGVRHVAPSHCTGEGVIALFEEAYGERFIVSGAGKILRGADLD
jgi:7,8-dihydropterin-6-yl-methyl-4-(beta-D-ribofuranosyl)aminobenzene 5'-phosphate synthase